MYLEGLKSRHPLRLCPICGQPLEKGSNKIIISEYKIDRRKKYWSDGRVKQKTLYHVHFKCKNKLNSLLS